MAGTCMHARELVGRVGEVAGTCTCTFAKEVLPWSFCCGVQVNPCLTYGGRLAPCYTDLAILEAARACRTQQSFMRKATEMAIAEHRYILYEGQVAQQSSGKRFRMLSWRSCVPAFYRALVAARGGASPSLLPQVMSPSSPSIPTIPNEGYRRPLQCSCLILPICYLKMLMDVHVCFSVR